MPAPVIESIAIALGIVISIAIITGIALNYTYTHKTLISEVDIDLLAEEVLKILITTPGSPSNWEFTSQVPTQLGFAESPYVLSSSKLSTIENVGTLCQIQGIQDEDVNNIIGTSSVLKVNGIDYMYVPQINGSGYLSYSTVKNVIFGSDGERYDFVFQLKPALKINITIKPLQQGLNITVYILNNLINRSQSNAKVDIVNYLYYSDDVVKVECSGYTNINGTYTCIINVDNTDDLYEVISIVTAKYSTLKNTAIHVWFNEDKNLNEAHDIDVILRKSNSNYTVIILHPKKVKCDESDNNVGSIWIQVKQIDLISKTSQDVAEGHLVPASSPSNAQGQGSPLSIVECSELGEPGRGVPAGGCYLTIPKDSQSVVTIEVFKCLNDNCLNKKFLGAYIIPINYISSLYLSNIEELTFGTHKMAPQVSTAKSIVTINDDTYLAILRLYKYLPGWVG